MGDTLVVIERFPLAQSLVTVLDGRGIPAAVMPEPGRDGSVPDPTVPGRSAAILDAAVGAPGDAPALTRALQEAAWEVLVLCAPGDLLAAAACLEAGAVAAIPVGASLDDVVAAVQAVRRGMPLGGDGGLRDQLLAILHQTRRESARRRRPFERLTPREREVLGKLTEGRHASDIADDWTVSVVTVRNQIQSVLTKLGVRSQLEAAALARRADWSLDESS